MKNQNKGITLVALVITIILLLVLVGITISSLTVSGLFEKAKEAKEKYKREERIENIKLSEYNNEVDRYINNSNRNGLSGNSELILQTSESSNSIEISNINDYKILIANFYEGDTGDLLVVSFTCPVEDFKQLKREICVGVQYVRSMATIKYINDTTMKVSMDDSGILRIYGIK